MSTIFFCLYQIRFFTRKLKFVEKRNKRDKNNRNLDQGGKKKNKKKLEKEKHVLSRASNNKQCEISWFHLKC